jgi:hypothetical protein
MILFQEFIRSVPYRCEVKKIQCAYSDFLAPAYGCRIEKSEGKGNVSVDPATSSTKTILVFERVCCIEVKRVQFSGLSSAIMHSPQFGLDQVVAFC